MVTGGRPRFRMCRAQREAHGVRPGTWTVFMGHPGAEEKWDEWSSRDSGLKKKGLQFVLCSRLGVVYKVRKMCWGWRESLQM